GLLLGTTLPAMEPGVDRLGDPLPDGAVARFGTTRLRHGWAGRSIAFAPDGQTIVTAGAFKVCVWDTATGKLVRLPSLPDHFLVEEADFSPDGKFILTLGDHGCRICVSDAETGKILKVLGERPKGNVGLPLSSPEVEWNPFPRELVVSPDGKHVGRLTF